jgi:hypothetical protein
MGLTRRRIRQSAQLYPRGHDTLHIDGGGYVPKSPVKRWKIHFRTFNQDHRQSINLCIKVTSSSTMCIVRRGVHSTSPSAQRNTSYKSRHPTLDETSPDIRTCDCARNSSIRLTICQHPSGGTESVMMVSHRWKLATIETDGNQVKDLRLRTLCWA